MRWNDERFIKLYTRDTVGWLALSWDARSVFLALLRKVDRAGLLDLGRHGTRGLAVLIGCEANVADTAVAELVSDGCVFLNGTVLSVPNFLEAQETPSSDAQRKRNERELARSRNVTESHEISKPVTTRRDETKQNKTKQDEVVETAPKERKQSTQEKFAQWFETKRVEALGDGYMSDVEFSFSRLNKELSWLKSYETPESREEVSRAVEIFMSDPYRLEKQDPPCSLRFFILDRAVYLSKAKRENQYAR